MKKPIVFKGLEVFQKLIAAGAYLQHSRYGIIYQVECTHNLENASLDNPEYADAYFLMNIGNANEYTFSLREPVTMTVTESGTVVQIATRTFDVVLLSKCQIK